MHILKFIFPVLLRFFLIGSFCAGLLRRHCQVMEKKYFSYVNFEGCKTFSDLDFSIAVNCVVEDLHTALKEVPLETDWLCLDYRGSTMEAGAFSSFTNLKSLYIIFSTSTASDVIGNVEMLPGTFEGLTRLSRLWIESTFLKFHEDTFTGLNNLKELKISELPLTALNLSVFSRLSLLEHLILENNNIEYLSEVTTQLEKFKNLRKLSVIRNIQWLRKEDCLTSPGTSSHPLVFNITYLDISDSSLQQFEMNSLCNFQRLEMFRADGSILYNESILQQGITSKTVSLSRSQYTGQKEIEIEICEYAFQFKAENLVINDNRLITINTLRGSCRGLKKLDLSFNDLSMVKAEQAERLNDLLELDLSNNQIFSLNFCINDLMQMNLKSLNASFNYIHKIEKRQFACLRNLQILSLENNKILQIENMGLHGLNWLQVLNLQYNKLSFVEDSIFSNLSLLRKINLYENKLMMTIDFHDLRNLQDLGLTYTLVSPYLSLYVLRLVRHLVVKGDSLQLENNYHLENVELDANGIYSCTIFPQVKELHLKNTIEFQCYHEPISPFVNFINLKKLYYTGNAQNFSDPTLNALNLLPSLQFLYLQDTNNIIKHGSVSVYGMFQGLSHLKMLHLRNSGIDRLDSTEIFKDLKELECLVIENQHIQEMTREAFEPLAKLKYIYFSQTTFPCDCKFSWILLWLEYETVVSIINFHDQECSLYQNTQNLMTFIQMSCRIDLDLVMFVTTFVFTLLFMCVSLFYETIWWYILYVVFTVKCWLNHKARDGEDYKYDVFVSYNTHDELWVVEQLLPHLELNGPPFFKLCIHNRDFEIGRDIVENIMDSIYYSRWTVCIITRSYLQSNWCSLEMRMAMYRILEESKESLILIFLDKISREELQHYHRVTKLLDKKTYLEWPQDEKGQQLFWLRLRKVIAKAGRKAK